ncbi:trypsin-like peptidase domain-containing protein [Patescibacteria group bacterium]|nr:trypsin-like peptidase domain-containing protein [Patescibacteria group bacterium]MBU1682827.1 trypsin-like peptidase domain-containing protein [Patescibacteria group bacterium]MBU1935443.1 trypsin-like peptidase domain-containing protein [Patescibacteria group bacterium]
MKKYRLSFGLIVLILIIALAGGILGGGLTVSLLGLNSTSDKTNETIIEKQVYVESSQIIDTVKEISPTVVSIVITKDLPLYRERIFNFNDPFFDDPFFDFPFAFPELDDEGGVEYETQKIGGGSGFIVTADGLVVTNRHVVDDSTSDYTIILNDGTEYDAEVVSIDTINDIAILRILSNDDEPIDGLSVAKMGDSDKIQVGQQVIAIGNALAEYENTVTTGVISAKGRSIVAGSVYSTESLINLIQTDAAINPGNSGGPLVNLDGEVIGINTAIAVDAQGIGFAIPINDVSSIIESVKTYGKIIRPYLGVRFMMLDKEKAEELQIDVKYGALLVGDLSEGEFAVVPDSPAEEAGLEINDVVLEVNGQNVTVDQPLHVLISKNQPGDEITLKVWRDEEEFEVQVILAEAE